MKFRRADAGGVSDMGIFRQFAAFTLLAAKVPGFFGKKYSNDSCCQNSPG